MAVPGPGQETVDMESNEGKDILNALSQMRLDETYNAGWNLLDITRLCRSTYQEAIKYEICSVV